ncbi:MAG TPA: glycosyl hydrolase family 18 protein [Bryobacteraceae bacterium]|nr:glycosyl hydrolase family 18 protein [Bryobacteraceae bacterium]
MPPKLIRLFVLGAVSLHAAFAQGTVPTFQYAAGQDVYMFAGRDPKQSGTTTIPTVLVPITLAFEARQTAGKPFEMDASRHVTRVIRSPIFTQFVFPSGARTQYADAMLRATFPKVGDWRTLLGKPEVRPLKITVPAGSGYILTSRKSGRSIAVADLEFVQREVFKQISKQDGKLVILLTLNAAFYALGDATVCCSWGTHGVDSATGNSFVLGSYLHAAPEVVEDMDVQPLTQQLAEFIKNPLRDPLIQGRNAKSPGNSFPAWVRPGFEGSCAGTGAASTYFLLEPTNTNPKNNFPASRGFPAHVNGAVYHLQNTALLPWYIGPIDGLGSALSFPDQQALTTRSKPCPARGGRPGTGARPLGPPKPTVEPARRAGPDNGHKLIGYWAGYGSASSTFPLRQISPQWDIVLVAFSTPDRNEPEGTMQFRPPTGMDPAELTTDIAHLKSQGKLVMVSLGGGGQHFTLADPNRVPNFVSSVARIVTDYGFDGIDIDFESPSLSIAPGDTDFRNPTTPSIVNLISALRQLRDHFGPTFKISLVPEGTQIPAGYPSYGDQFGSYLPIAYALRDSLAFMDTQSYNTPPLQGLDGEIYQPETVDYHTAMTELWLRGFNAGGNPKYFFPPMPAEKVAVGFLNGDTTPGIVTQAMGLSNHRQSSCGNEVQTAHVRRLSWLDRGHVLDDRRRPPQQLQLLDHDRPPAPWLPGREVAIAATGWGRAGR